MTAQVSENLITIMDRVSSVKFYQGGEDYLYYAEVHHIDGSRSTHSEVTMEELLLDILAENN